MDHGIECTCQMSSLCAKHQKFPDKWIELDNAKPLTSVMKDAIACHDGEYSCGCDESGVHSTECTEAWFEANARIAAMSTLMKVGRRG